MAIYLWCPSEPGTNRKWNARDLQAQGACALRFLDHNMKKRSHFNRNLDILKKKVIKSCLVLCSMLNLHITSVVYCTRQIQNKTSQTDLIFSASKIISNSPPFLLKMSCLSHFMILCYLLSTLFSRVVLPTQAESILPALRESAVKRERTTNNAKS